MKALVYTAPQTITLQDVPVPLPAAGDLLIAVAAVGICGSDMHAFHGHDERRPPPLILGHEAAGTIASGPRKGERVTINPLVTCMTCDACLGGRPHLCAHRQIISMPPRPGAFADYVTIPVRNVVPIPEEMPFETAALAEPLAVSWHAVRLGMEVLHPPLPVASCCVLGGGAIGVGAALALHRLGAARIHLAEPNAQRRATAQATGILTAYAPGTPAEPEPGSVDFVIDAVGAASTRRAASQLAKPGGVIVHAGLLPSQDGLDVRRITLQEITFRGTYCYTQTDFLDVVRILSQGGFGSLGWVDRMPLTSGADAFSLIDGGGTPSAKIVLLP
jgi:L-iditol 2-dehydrogenase